VPHGLYWFLITRHASILATLLYHCWYQLSIWIDNQSHFFHLVFVIFVYLFMYRVTSVPKTPLVIKIENTIKFKQIYFRLTHTVKKIRGVEVTWSCRPFMIATALNVDHSFRKLWAFTTNTHYIHVPLQT